MIEREVRVTNRAGIHARPAALIVQTASRFASKITLGKDSEEINAKSIMGIITLGTTESIKTSEPAKLAMVMP